MNDTLDLMDELGRFILADEQFRTKDANVQALAAERGFYLNNVLPSH